jgi:hypothetical protein
MTFMTDLREKAVGLFSFPSRETVIVPINEKKTLGWDKWKRAKRKPKKPAGRHSQEFVLSHLVPSNYYPDKGLKSRPKGWSRMLAALYPEKDIEATTTLSVLRDEDLASTKTIPFVVKEPYRPPVSPAPAGAGRYYRKAA